MKMLKAAHGISAFFLSVWILSAKVKRKKKKHRGTTE